jgi:competence protein ComEA
VGGPWRVLEDNVEPPAPALAVVASGADGATPGRRWLAVGVAIAIALAVATAVLATSGGDGSLVVDAAAQAGAIAGAPTPRPVSSAGAGSTTAAQPTGSTGTTLGSTDAADVVVEVNGAVRRPGLYHLAAGSRVGDAIAAAGGYSGRIDAAAAQGLNLAARVTDGQQIHAPARDERVTSGSRPAGSTGAGTGTGGATASAPPAGPLNLNTATGAQLEGLPGIGPATAAKIIAAREEKGFGSVQELRDRKLVGAATFEKIKKLVTTN